MKSNPLLHVEQLAVGQMQENCYLVYDTHTSEAVIVDPGEDDEYIMDKIHELELKPTQIIATHGHFDHILAGFSIQKTFHIPFAIHKNDLFLVDHMVSSANHFLGFETHSLPPQIDELIQNGMKLKVGIQNLAVLETPGHTPGSVSLIDETRSFALVGDLIFAGGGVGRTDFSYSNARDLTRSIEDLFSYPDEMTIYAGHGERTTVGECKKYYGKN